MKSHYNLYARHKYQNISLASIQVSQGNSNSQTQTRTNLNKLKKCHSIQHLSTTLSEIVHRSLIRPVSTTIWLHLPQSVQLVIHVSLRLLKSATILLFPLKVFTLVLSVVMALSHSTRSKKNVLIPTLVAKLSELSTKPVTSKKQLSLVSPSSSKMLSEIKILFGKLEFPAKLRLQNIKPLSVSQNAQIHQSGLAGIVGVKKVPLKVRDLQTLPRIAGQSVL